MEEILKEILHIPVKEKAFDGENKLPLLLLGLYDIKVFMIGKKSVYMIQPKEHVSLPQLKKHFVKLKMLLGEDCILYADKYTQYAIFRLIELNIPFIFGNNNIYLPNLGIRIHDKPKAKLPDVKQFSPFTQKFVLMALYCGWKTISGKEIAELLKVSRMTVNRALIELEALSLPLTEIKGKTKYFKNDFSKKELFGVCEEYLVSPVKKTVKLKHIPDYTFVKSGGSAIAEYSLLGESAYPVFAIDREGYSKLEIKQEEIVAKGEEPACIIQIHRYLIDKNGVVDPISAILSMSSSELEDARVEQAIEETKEGVFNGRWT